MKIGTTSTLNIHHSGEPDFNIGAMVNRYHHEAGTRPGPGRDQVGTKSLNRLPTLSDEHVAEHVAEQVTEHVRRLILCLKENILGRQDAMQCLGLSHHPTFLYDYLKPAIQVGLVEMTQPDSPKNPTQKYHLTETGRAVLVGEQKGDDA